MTTIAYHRELGVMAADTQMTSCNRKFRCTKVYRLGCGGLIGGSGSASDIMKIVRWAEAGFDIDNLPEFKGDDGPEVECIIVKGDGSVFLLDSEMELFPVQDGFVATGSGCNYATAAMACGLSPVEAVKVAARFDAATSEPVESWTLEPPRKVAKKAAKKVAKKK